MLFLFQVRLVKQNHFAEERKCLVKQSENIFEDIIDDLDLHDQQQQQSGMDSPKFLIPPGKFDSTPRSRSQSVELPEFMMGHCLPMNLSEHQSNRKMSLSCHHDSVSASGPSDVHVMVKLGLILYFVLVCK